MPPSMGYWGRVTRRAWREAKKGAGIGTFDRTIALIFTQSIIAVLIYIGLGETAVRDDLATRIATAVAPFAFLPLFFLLKLPTVPPVLEREWEQWKTANDEQKRQTRAGLLWQIKCVYGKENPDAHTAAMAYNLEWPPIEYLNAKLEEYGEPWRVTATKGPNFETEELGG